MSELDYLPWKREGEDSAPFISPLAKLYGIEALTLGADSFVAADALLRELWLTAGERCSFNSGCYIQGKVTMGNDVRIAPGAKIIGMNHRIDNPDIPMTQSGLSYQGITIEDDVWVGAGAIVLDGVHIGAHSVIAAGAVVTKSVAPYSVVGGNPARLIKNRRTEQQAAQFVAQMQAELPRVIAYYEQSGVVRNEPFGEETIRAKCDKIELLGMFDALPEDKSALIGSILPLQKETVDYDCLTIGYAMEVLGTAPMKPFSQCDEIFADFDAYLQAQKWDSDGWNVGANVDHLATALYFNHRYHGARTQQIDQLFQALLAHQNPDTGLFAHSTLHLDVNGFYRLARGSFHQFRRLVPRISTMMDSVLRHSRTHRMESACDALDIIWPLWYATTLTDYRRKEGEAWARELLEVLPSLWKTGEGFPFSLEDGAPATLQGTEMWCAIFYYLCQYLNIPCAIRPKGVHRSACYTE